MGQGADTRVRILQEALQIFSHHGFESARMEKIASAVGNNKSSLYFHFKSKEEIFRTLFQMIIKKYPTALNQIFEKSKSLPSKERLSSIYKNYLEYHWNNTEMDFWNMVYYYPPEMMRDEIIRTTLDSSNTLIDALTDIMEEGIQKKELNSLNAKNMAKSFYYLLTCISISTDMMSMEQGMNDMESCFEVFWNGIKGI